MSEGIRQRTVEERIQSGGASGSDGLAGARTEIDELFAVASQSFEALRQGTSQEFLRRSRQTGGQ